MEGLKGDLHALRVAVQRVDDRTEERHKQAAEGRKQLYETVGNLRQDVQNVESIALRAEFSALAAKKVTDRVEQWEQRGRGAFIVLGLLGTMLVGATAKYADAVIQFFRSRLGL